MTVVADVLRGDLPFPDKNHGFNAWFLRDSGVADGQAHQLYAYAIASTGGQLVALNGNPKELLCGRGSRGVLEGIVDGGAAVGWTYDPASPNDSSTVAFYVDAPYPSGKSAGQATTALVRNDVNQLIGASGAHGFVWSIPNDWRDGQTHKLFAYAISEKTGNQLVMGSSMPFRAQPVALSTGEPYTIGAWYFDAWNSANDFQAVNAESVYGRHDWWGGVRDYALGADPWGLHVDYSDRQPQIGFYDLLEPSAYDAHLRQSAAAGLSFFAHYWYWYVDRNEEVPFSSALRTLLSSPVKDLSRFLIAPIMLSKATNDTATLARAAWETSVVPFMVRNYIIDPSYLRTDDDRPVVDLMGVSFTNPSDTPGAVMFLRDAVIRATGKNPLVLATHFDGQPRADVISGIEEVNFDGFAGFYGFPTRPAQPYAETMATWATATGVQNGFFHIPCASTGVDARPWWLIGWGNAGGINSRPYNPDISLQGFATHLSDVKTYLDADQSDTGKALVIYAWNEWGEGGIIEPSRVRGSAYLDSIRSTFGLTPVSEGVFELPVVLDARGQGMSHFTSDLVVTNRGAVPARVSLTYRSSAGTLNSPPVSTTETIDAGRELRISEVIAYLRDKGLSIVPAGSSVVGALSVSVLDGGDPSALFVGSRTSTPNPNTSVGGSFGLFVAATKQSTAPAGIVTIVGLREDSRTRSNLAIVDVPSGTGPASLEIHLYDGDSGKEAGIPIRYALQPGEWKQFGSILGMYGISNGYAIVKRIDGGTNRFLVYGVANDGGESGGGTSDGSYIGSGASAGFVPIVLRVPSGGAAFTSELILTNTNPGPVDAVMTYTPAAQLAAGPSFQTTVTLGGGRQLRIPDVISYFRSRGLPLPAGEAQGGTLNVSGANTLVRTSIPNPDAAVGGSFGLTYPAYSISSRASAGAWIFGLRQDATARSNVAIADARVGDASIIRYVVEVFDSDSGGVAPIATLEPIPLSGGRWYQVSGILAKLGVSHGYVHVRPESGTSDFVVYGVVNDGASPGQGTSDGSYIPMIVTPR